MTMNKVSTDHEHLIESAATRRIDVVNATVDSAYHHAWRFR